MADHAGPPVENVVPATLRGAVWPGQVCAGTHIDGGPAGATRRGGEDR